MSELAGCDLCGHDTGARVAEGSRFGIRTSVVLCPRCGFVYQSPRTEQSKLSAFYAEDYRRLYSGSNEEPPATLIEEQVERGKRILAFCGGLLPEDATVLDVGCGPGAMLLPFRDAGHRVVGVEPGPYGVWGARHLGLDVRPGMLEDLVRGGDVLADLVVLSFVLEHVPSPRALLEAVRGILRGWGLVFAEIPNLRSARGPSGDYFHVAHLSYFTPRTLRALMETAGFEVLRFDPGRVYSMRIVVRPGAGGPAAPDWERIGDSPREVQAFVKRYVTISAVESFVKRVTLAVLEPIAALVGRAVGHRAGRRLIDVARRMWRRARYGDSG